MENNVIRISELFKNEFEKLPQPKEIRIRSRIERNIWPLSKLLTRWRETNYDAVVQIITSNKDIDQKTLFKSIKELEIPACGEKGSRHLSQLIEKNIARYLFF